MPNRPPQNNSVLVNLGSPERPTNELMSEEEAKRLGLPALKIDEQFVKAGVVEFDFSNTEDQFINPFEVIE